MYNEISSCLNRKAIHILHPVYSETGERFVRLSCALLLTVACCVGNVPLVLWLRKGSGCGWALVVRLLLGVHTAVTHPLHVHGGACLWKLVYF